MKIFYLFVILSICSKPAVHSYIQPKPNLVDFMPIKNSDDTISIDLESTTAINKSKLSHNSQDVSIQPLHKGSELFTNPQDNVNHISLCELPSDPQIIPITPSQLNAGWAMSPHEKCSPGSWCPYACRSGMYSAQWDPNSKCSIGPKCGSKNGGLFCDAKGKLVKPFPEKPLCSPGLPGVQITNRLDKSVSVCQTVYPGNEVMIIPTVAHPSETTNLLTPPSTYWFNTSAHFYVNMPGSDAGDCAWGQSDKPVGNWAPFIIGTNQGFQDNIFVSVKVNPLFVESGLIKKHKAFAIELKCNGNCSNQHCKVSTLTTNESCTITILPNSNLEIVFNST